MASWSFRVSRSDLSTDSDMLDPSNRKSPLPLPPSQNRVMSVRRTSSDRYVTYSRDDLESELGSNDFLNYTVQMPSTPDNQPNNTNNCPVSQKVEEQSHYVSNSLFTGGSNSITQAHLMDKVIDSDTASHSRMAGFKRSSCSSTAAVK